MYKCSYNDEHRIIKNYIMVICDKPGKPDRKSSKDKTYKGVIILRSSSVSVHTQHNHLGVETNRDSNIVSICSALYTGVISSLLVKSAKRDA